MLKLNTGTIVATFVTIVAFWGIYQAMLSTTPNKPVVNSISADTTTRPPLTVNNVLVEICKQDIKEPLIVLKQCIVETRWLQCTNCSMDYNNLFGFGWNGKTYFKYKHWTESIKDYKRWQDKYLKVNENYYDFLKRIGYAEDPGYENKLQNIKL